MFSHFLFDPCNSFEISESKREQGHRDDTRYQATANRRNRRSVNNTGTVNFEWTRRSSGASFFRQRLVGFIAIRAPSASSNNTRFTSTYYRSKHNKLSLYQVPASRSFSIDRSNESPTYLGSKSFTSILDYLFLVYYEMRFDRRNICGYSRVK